MIVVVNFIDVLVGFYDFGLFPSPTLTATTMVSTTKENRFSDRDGTKPQG